MNTIIDKNNKITTVQKQQEPQIPYNLKHYKQKPHIQGDRREAMDINSVVQKSIPSQQTQCELQEKMAQSQKEKEEKREGKINNIEYIVQEQIDSKDKVTKSIILNPQGALKADQNNQLSGQQQAHLEELEDILYMQQDPNCIRIHFDELNDPQIEHYRANLFYQALDNFSQKLKLQKSEQLKIQLEKEQHSQVNKVYEQSKQLSVTEKQKKKIKEMEQIKDPFPKLNEKIVNNIMYDPTDINEPDFDNRYRQQQGFQDQESSSIIDSSMPQSQSGTFGSQRQNQSRSQSRGSQMKIDSMGKVAYSTMGKLPKAGNFITQKQFLRDTNVKVLHNLFMYKVNQKLYSEKDNEKGKQQKLQKQENNQENQQILNFQKNIQQAQDSYQEANKGNRKVNSQEQKSNFRQFVKNQKVLDDHIKDILKQECNKFKNLMLTFKNTTGFKNPGLTVQSKELVTKIFDRSESQFKQKLEGQLNELKENKDFFQSVEKSMMAVFNIYVDEIQQKHQKIDGFRHKNSQLQGDLNELSQEIGKIKQITEQKIIKMQNDHFKRNTSQSFMYTDSNAATPQNQFNAPTPKNFRRSNQGKHGSNIISQRMGFEKKVQMVRDQENMDIKEINQQILQIRDEINKNQNEIDTIGKHLSIAKSHKQNLENLLKDHYLSRLRSDPTVAKLSYSWLIKVLKQLGEKELHPSLFPDVLDMKNIEFLHNLADKEQELDKLHMQEVNYAKSQLKYLNDIKINDLVSYNVEELNMAMHNIVAKRHNNYDIDYNYLDIQENENEHQQQNRKGSRQSFTSQSKNDKMGKLSIQMENSQQYSTNKKDNSNQSTNFISMQNSPRINQDKKFQSPRNRVIDIDEIMQENKTREEQKLGRLFSNSVKDRILKHQKTVAANSPVLKKQYEDVVKSKDKQQMKNSLFSPFNGQEQDKLLGVEDITKKNLMEQSRNTKRKIKEIKEQGIFKSAHEIYLAKKKLENEMTLLKENEYKRVVQIYQKAKTDVEFRKIYDILHILFGSEEGDKKIEQFEHFRKYALVY